MRSYIKEACVGNLEEARRAEVLGADRLELCAELHIGGTTPSREMLLRATQEINIPLRIMIRPRGGDFVYSASELEEMRDAIMYCKKLGVEAVVFGALNAEHQLDLEVISELTQMAAPLKVVIHKAIDDTPDPVAAVKALASIEGIVTVLTSGGKATASEGKEVLKEMLRNCGGLEIMPAGKVSRENLEDLHLDLNARAYHGKLIVGSLD